MTSRSPPAIDPTERLLTLAAICARRAAAAPRALRLAADLARALDALLIEEIDPRKLRGAVAETAELARHWQHSLERLQLIFEQWPATARRARRDRPRRAAQPAAASAGRALEARAAAGLHGRRRHHHRGAGRRGAGRARCANAGGHGRAARPVAGEHLSRRGMGCARPGREGPRRGRRIRNSI